MEAIKREQELNELRKKMREEQQLKFKEHTKSQGNHWRSATNNQKIYGYSDMVLDHYTKESNESYSNPQSAQLKKRIQISKGKNNSGKIISK